MESNAPSSAQQQLMEYRLRKKREAEANARAMRGEPIAIPIPQEAHVQDSYSEELKDPLSPNRRETTSKEEDELKWRKEQEEYKKRLMEGSVQPVKLKVFDFTQGSENQKRLEVNNYDFLPTTTINEPKYKKEDIKFLCCKIGFPKTEPSETQRREPLLPSIQQQREDDKNNEAAFSEPNRQAGAQMPLLLNLGREETVRRDFLCLRNINRDVIGLIAIFGLMAGFVSLLFLLSQF